MRIIGQEQMAAVFGIAPKTLIEWQEQGMPIAVRGRPGVPSEYDSDACIAWYVQREVKKVQGEKPQDRLARLQADRIEIELMKERGQLLPADQIEPKLRAALIAAREMWRNEPARLAREVPGKPIKEIEDLLAGSYEALLLKLSRWQDAAVIDEEGEF